ncbi:MAG: hypothetical protein U5P10_00305 [Spirochaetia bacterium]|nr:hypothetical protein [Spirochaetia bacterium]
MKHFYFNLSLYRLLKSSSQIREDRAHIMVLHLSWRSSYYQELDYGFWRTDVYQGLHRQER